MRLIARPRVFYPSHKEVALLCQFFAHGVDINVLAQCRIGFWIQVVPVVFRFFIFEPQLFQLMNHPTNRIIDQSVRDVNAGVLKA